MWKYRYHREVIPDDIWETRCNELGEQGWSMLGLPDWQQATPFHEEPDIYHREGWLCFFKRTVSNREQLRALFAMSPQEVTP